MEEIGEISLVVRDFISHEDLFKTAELLLS